MEEVWDVWVQSTGVAIATIADRGTAAEIVSRGVAEMLVRERLVDRIHPLAEEVWIQFGVETARVPAVGVIYGQGPLGELFVVENGLPLVLISDISFTEKGVVLVQDNTHLLGVAYGQIELVGRRDATAPRTDTAAMWQLDLRLLLRRPDPRLRARMEEAQHQLTALEVARLMQVAWVEGGAVVGKEAGSAMVCAGAHPTYAIADVRAGRRFLKNVGISPFTVAATLENPALKNVPAWLTPALMRAIGHARGNVPGMITTARKHPAGGTGIASTQPGEVMCWDIIGKFPASTWGCEHGAGVHDEATKWGDGYGLLSGERGKGDLDGAVVMYCQSVEAMGKGPVRQMRFDAGSEATRHGELTRQFRVICAKYGFVLTASAADDQATNPQERTWQDTSHRMANMFLQQDNLLKNKWLLVWFAAIVMSHAVVARR